MRRKAPARKAFSLRRTEAGAREDSVEVNMPSAMRVRFTGSGNRNETESVSLARLAKILTVAAAFGAAVYFALLYLLAGR